MVHALHEARLVLRNGGTLVDLRPFACKPSIEVVTSEEAVAVGTLDDSASIHDDVAADHAMNQVIESGWFIPSRETVFEMERYWDSVKEMKAFLDTRRHKIYVSPAYAELEKIHLNRSDRARGMARLRCRQPAKLAVLMKPAFLKT